jgi:aminoglycoside 2'-N-acetyltransferase I
MWGMQLRTAHTGELDDTELDAVRKLLADVFDDLTADDVEHCLGGVHALAWEDGRLVGHASVVQRRLLHGGRALRAGYVEGVAVRADRRGRGYGAAVMKAVEQVARRAYVVAALATTAAAAGFYAARGWQLWRGPSSALSPTGIRRTEDDDGGIYVLTLEAPLDLDAELTCDWRDGDVW